MAEQHHHHPRNEDDGPLPDPVAVGHETSDVRSGPIIRFLIFLAIVCLSAAGLMVVFHDYLERREAAEKTGRYPIAAGRQRPLPPPPRLQTEPFGSIKELRAAERQRLDRYEWIDRNAGTVRIPIGRAMELTLERGLPHRAQQPAAAPDGGAQPESRPRQDGPTPQGTDAPGDRQPQGTGPASSADPQGASR